MQLCCIFEIIWMLTQFMQFPAFANDFECYWICPWWPWCLLISWLLHIKCIGVRLVWLHLLGDPERMMTKVETENQAKIKVGIWVAKITIVIWTAKTTIVIWTAKITIGIWFAKIRIVICKAKITIFAWKGKTKRR